MPVLKIDQLQNNVNNVFFDADVFLICLNDAFNADVRSPKYPDYYELFRQKDVCIAINDVVISEIERNWHTAVKRPDYGIGHSLDGKALDEVKPLAKNELWIQLDALSAIGKTRHEPLGPWTNDTYKYILHKPGQYGKDLYK